MFLRGPHFLFRSTGLIIRLSLRHSQSIKLTPGAIIALSSLCFFSSRSDETLSFTGSNRTPTYHFTKISCGHLGNRNDDLISRFVNFVKCQHTSDLVYGDLTAIILLIIAGSPATRSLGPTRASDPNGHQSLHPVSLKSLTWYTADNLPYFSFTA